jgi:twitching motility protein PilJ
LIFQFYLSRPALVFGLGYGQTPYQMVKDRQWFFPYFYEDQRVLGQKGVRLDSPHENTFYSELTEEDDYPEQDYYKLPVKLGRNLWMEPYGSYGATITTFATVIKNNQGKTIGVANVDLNVTKITQALPKTVLGESGYFTIVSSEGNILAYPPDPQKAIQLEKYDKIPEIGSIWQQLQAKSQGLIETNKDYWVYQKIPRTNWLMLAKVPQSAIINPILQISLAGVFGATLLLALVILLFVYRLNRRLQPVLDKCNELVVADEVMLQKMRTEDEIGQLQISFFNLLEQIKNNEELIRQEVARAVQKDEQLKLAQQLNRESEVLTQEIGEILDVLSSVEQGDLTVSAKVSENVTGLVADTLNRLIEELTEIMTQVLETAEKVSLGISNLEQITNMVTHDAEQQSESAETVLQMSQGAKEAAENASRYVEDTNVSLQQLNDAVVDGSFVISTLDQGIQTLRQGTDKMIQQIKTLGEFVGLADQFTQEQGEIAQQTQILALNAALVAARAAEQKDPRKFVLVAQEFEEIANQVSKLAQETNNGLIELEQRTAQIHQVVAAINTEVQSLGGLVGGFTDGVQQSNELFSNVSAVTEKAIQAGITVAKASEEIVSASQTTVQSMEDIANLAKQTAQLSKRSLRHSELMGELSNKLLDKIEFFHLPTRKIKKIENIDSNVDMDGALDMDIDLDIDFDWEDNEEDFEELTQHL